MALTYTSYIAALSDLTVIPSTDANFQTILPDCIDYAELRIQRELNLLQTVTQDASTSTTASQRSATISNAFVVVNGINVLNGSARYRMTPTTRDVIDTLYPDTTITGVPQLFAMIGQWNLILGPAPDATYSLEVTGTQRFTPLSDGNPSNFISTYLPDLLIAASMVFMSGYMRNFGAEADDPKMAQSWEQQYQTLKASANDEELRKHMWAASWTPHPVSPAAQPQRG
jgi:hypothetical protein